MVQLNVFVQAFSASLRLRASALSFYFFYGAIFLLLWLIVMFY